MDDNKIHHRYHQATNLVVVVDLKTIFAVYVAVMHLCLLLESTVDIHSIGIYCDFFINFILNILCTSLFLFAAAGSGSSKFLLPFFFFQSNV